MARAEPRLPLISRELLTEPLAAEVAELAQGAIRGFSDERPVNGALVASRLNSPANKMEPEILVCRHRGQVIAGLAVRTPTQDEPRARLWGPVVAGAHRRRGVGSALMSCIHRGAVTPLRSTDIPEDRPAAGLFFTRHGWRVGQSHTIYRAQRAAIPRLAPAAGIHSAARLPVADATRLVVAAAERFGDPLAGAAAGVFDRWGRDHRFRLDNILVDPTSGGMLLALPQRNGDASELLIAELWCPPDAAPNLLHAAVAVMDGHGASSMRLVRDSRQPSLSISWLRPTGSTRTYFTC